VLQSVVLRKFGWLDGEYYNGDRLNMKTVASIAREAGLVKPYVDRYYTGYNINGEIGDPYGEAVSEILSIYSYCEWIKKQESK